MTLANAFAFALTDGIMRAALLALLLPAAAHAIATQAQLDTLRAAIIANFSLTPSYGGQCGPTGCTQGHVIGCVRGLVGLRLWRLWCAVALRSCVAAR